MSALDDAASMDPWAHGQLQRMKEELTRLRAEVEALTVQRNLAWKSAIDAALFAIEIADHNCDDSGNGANENAYLAVKALRGEGEK